jgi:hypothetical protein
MSEGTDLPGAPSQKSNGKSQKLPLVPLGTLGLNSSAATLPKRGNAFLEQDDAPQGSGPRGKVPSLGKGTASGTPTHPLLRSGRRKMAGMPLGVSSRTSGEVYGCDCSNWWPVVYDRSCISKVRCCSGFNGGVGLSRFCSAYTAVGDRST